MKWYVFDQSDCFDFFSTAAAAAAHAEFLLKGGMRGIHIVCMSLAQFQAYCQHGDLKRALEENV